MLARQVLYHNRHAYSACFHYFLDRVCAFDPGMVLYYVLLADASFIASVTGICHHI
jgi:hypothetical protein